MYPNRAPYGDRDPFTGYFYIYLETLIKIPLNNTFPPFSQRPLEKCTPPCSSKAEPYGSRPPFPEPYLTYLSGYPVREPSLQILFMESLRDRCSVPRDLLHSSFKVPGMRAPFQIPGFPQP